MLAQSWAVYVCLNCGTHWVNILTKSRPLKESKDWEFLQSIREYIVERRVKCLVAIQSNLGLDIPIKYLVSYGNDGTVDFFFKLTKYNVYVQSKLIKYSECVIFSLYNSNILYPSNQNWKNIVANRWISIAYTHSKQLLKNELWIYLHIANNNTSYWAPIKCFGLAAQLGFFAHNSVFMCKSTVLHGSAINDSINIHECTHALSIYRRRLGFLLEKKPSRNTYLVFSHSIWKFETHWNWIFI